MKWRFFEAEKLSKMKFEISEFDAKNKKMQENLTIQNIVFGYDFINIAEMQTKKCFFVFHWKSELNKLYFSVGIKKPVANIGDKLKINI